VDVIFSAVNCVCVCGGGGWGETLYVNISGNVEQLQTVFVKNNTNVGAR
jgi:hypothetical protein